MKTPARLPLGLLVATCALLLGSPSQAAWQPAGVLVSPTPPVDPNRSTSYYLRNLLADGTGGAYVTWLYDSYFPLADQTDFAFGAQRIDVNGNRPAPWTAAGSTIFSWVSSPGQFGITNAEPIGWFADGAGGAVHALVSSSQVVEPHSNFNLHHVQSNAIVTGFPGFTGDFSGSPSPAATAADGDGAGGVLQIVRAQTFAPPLVEKPPQPLTVRRIAPDGTILWSIDDLVPPGQSTDGLAALGDGTGGGWFAWIDSREVGDPDVYVVRLTAAGSPAPGWPATGVLACGAAGAQFEPHLAKRAGDESVYVMWRDVRDGSSRLFVQHLLADGTLVPGMPADGQQLASGDTEDRFADACADAAGGLFVMRSGKTGLVQTAALHHLGVTGNPVPGWPSTGIALSNPFSYGLSVGLAADAVDGAFVSFRRVSGPPPPGLYAQHFAGNGTPAAGWTPDGVLLSSTGFSSKLVRSGTGAIVAWDDGRSDAPGVYAQRLVTDGPVATEMALVESSVSPDGVVLHWFASEGAGLPVTIERRTADTDWATRVQAVCDGTGHLRVEDADVLAGTRYGYRATWSEGGTRQVSAETWLTVPAEVTTLALESPFPNPSSGVATIALSLPTARPARLEIVDLAGRRMAERELALGAGRHVLALDEARSLAPGLYLVRLTHAGESRVARLLHTP